MEHEGWLLDVTNSDGKPPFVFCPMDSDGKPIIGLMFVADEPPGELIGVLHLDGEEAAVKWVEEHPGVYELLR